MKTQIQDQISSFADTLLSYLPSLIGGIILVLLGWLIGWLVKKVLIQLSIVLHLDRFLKRSRSGADFSKADVRYSLYSFIGNVGFVIIFLIFLDNALLTWNLKILSDLLNKGILFLPKIIIALAIFGLGWLIASWVQISTFKTLHREDIPRASLISKFIKSIILVFFSAVSFVELDVAREIIIIAFATIFITLGLLTVAITVIGGHKFLKKIEDSLRDEKNEK